MPAHGTRMAIHLLLLMGVAKLGVVGADQSELRVNEDQPIRELGAEGVQTPEVVLQLKYDGGALDRIYLAQYRQGRGSIDPAVPIRDSLCSDLCHSGLGGEGCGSTCHALVPVGLESALHHHGENSTDIQQKPNSLDGMGMPRRYVCPVLCANNLGEPLCNCGEVQSLLTPDWAAVCSAFCQDDVYVLRGCPSCSVPVVPARTSRVLATNDGWAAWCNVQCRQGHGGAACNCDRAPFQ